MISVVCLVTIIKAVECVLAQEASGSNSSICSK